MLDTNFYPLSVVAIEAAAEGSVILTLQPDAATLPKFEYQAGQYLTLRFELNGQEYRRAYSLCSSPVMDKLLQVAVKQIPKGVISTHINQQTKVGHRIDAMPPQGHFSPDINIDHKKDYFLFAGGSGITPMFSILKTIIEAEPKSRVMLFYANRHEESIMFRAQIDALTVRYRDQLFVRHLLSQPKSEKKGGLFGLFAKSVSSWTGKTGRTSQQNVAQFVQQYRAEDGRAAEFFLCGPEGMMATVTSTLAGIGIDKADIHQEYFADTNYGKTEVSADTGGKTVIATLNKKKVTIQLQPNETILKGLIRSKANPPFSCTSGACSTCMAKLVAGKVEMSRCLALDESEVNAGFILTCTSTPTTDVVEINYDV
jgi:ring-1,2-phenylacetyl-CoA epoxidase subunit PaaE